MPLLRGVTGSVVRTVCPTTIPLRMSGWSSPSWNWGSAVGDAHNEAMRIRGALRDEELRRQWLVSMIGGSSAVEWEDVKLVLALKWQKAARERRDADYGFVMERLRLAEYEGDQQDEVMVADMEARLDQLRPDAKEMEAFFMAAQNNEGGIYQDLPDAHRRAVAARVLVGLDFVAQGL